jgi:hypothetical protein
MHLREVSIAWNPGGEINVAPMASLNWRDYRMSTGGTEPHLRSARRRDKRTPRTC